MIFIKPAMKLRRKLTVHLNFILLSTVLIFLLSCSRHTGNLTESNSKNNNYVWLHIDGQHIRRSPLCTDPNGIWMGCGMARKTSIPRPTKEQAEEFAVWCVNNHFNLARLRWNIDTVS